MGFLRKEVGSAAFFFVRDADKIRPEFSWLSRELTGFGQKIGADG
jgi:hypothetical protein